MDELCGLRQISVRCTGLSIVVLALILALAPAAATQAAPAGPGVFAAPSTSDGGGQDATATGDGEDDEGDIDEWEGDILKLVAGPAPDLMDRLLAALGRLAGSDDRSGDGVRGDARR